MQYNVNIRFMYNILPLRTWHSNLVLARARTE